MYPSVTILKSAHPRYFIRVSKHRATVYMHKLNNNILKSQITNGF